MTPSLSYGQPCPCGIGTVTGVMDGRVTAKHVVMLAAAPNFYVPQGILHSHTFAEVATMLRKAKWREVDRKHWPHECPRCRAPAYVGAVPAALDCSDRCAS